MTNEESPPRDDPYRDGYGRIRTQGRAPKPFLRPAIERAKQIIVDRILSTPQDDERERGPKS